MVRRSAVEPTAGGIGSRARVALVQGPGVVPGAMCTIAQTVILPRVRIVTTPRRPVCGENHMLFIVGVVVVWIAVAIVPRMRLPGGVNSTNLGWMSEQWLAEHRASHAR